MKQLKGIGASTGIAIGKIFMYTPKQLPVNAEEKDSLPFSEKKEILERVINAAEKEIDALYKNTRKNAEKEAEIFQAHILFLKDPTIIKKIDELLKQNFTLPAAVKKAFEESVAIMEKMENPYFKARAKDLRDVEERLLRKISGIETQSLSSIPYPAIIVAKDLTPSDTASLDRKNVLGFVTETGGITSHTAILAEALGIPAVVGVRNILSEAKNGMLAILDGSTGDIILEPDETTLARYRQKKEQYEREKKELEKVKFLSVSTKSGKTIEVSANIGKTDDINIAINSGADGIGLFRTEFLFLDREIPPSEEEQFNAYKKVLEAFGSKPVIIRTLDIGGDKQIPYLGLEKELNPFLGVRAIRLCLKNKGLFKTQLRAILRASIYGNVKIMYPMIAIKDEIIEANNLLKTVKKELTEEGVAYKKDFEVGIMVEIPSAALNADELIKYVDFFSIGTNDLIQYTFAADRTNRNVSYLYNPLHPSILKLIEMTIKASHKHNKWTGMCGEMAGDPKAIPILLKMGIDELSMSPSKIPNAKKLIMETE